MFEINFHDEKIHALHQTIGEVVGTDCGATLMSSLVLLAKDIQLSSAFCDELIAEAFERSAGADLLATRNLVDQGQDPLEQLRFFFDSYTRSDGNSGMQLWLDAWAEAARRPELRQISQRLNEAWQQLICGIIEGGVRGGFMTCTDPVAAAWRILSLLDGLHLQEVAHSDSVTSAQVTNWSRRGAEIELGLPLGTLTERQPS